MLYFVLLITSASSSYNCLYSNCTACESGYLFNSVGCLDLCPSTYTLNTATNNCTASTSQNLFYMSFNSFQNFTASSIPPFSHPLGLPFNDPQRLSPIPTKERGFYFASTSKLVSSIS